MKKLVFSAAAIMAGVVISDIESANLVGYVMREIRKGTTPIEMPFTDVERHSFLTLSVFHDVAVPDDEIFYYATNTTSSSSGNICFHAQVKDIGGTNHFVSVKTGAVVDDYLLPAVMPGSKLRILYKRKRNITSYLNLSGEVAHEIMSALSMTDLGVYASQSMDAFVGFLREGLFRMMEQHSPGGVYKLILDDEKALAQNDVKEYFSKSQESQKVQFVVYFSQGAKRVEFDAKTGTFMDIELSSTFYFDAGRVSGFGYIKDEKLPKEKKMPEWMVEEMNGLQKKHFFDDKRLLAVAFRDGSSVIARYVKDDDSLWNMQTDIRIGLDEDDVVAFSVPQDPNFTAWGVGRFLTKDEVVALDKRLLVKRREDARVWNRFRAFMKRYCSEVLVGVTSGLIVACLVTPLTVKFSRRRKRRGKWKIALGWVKRFGKRLNNRCSSVAGGNCRARRG